MAKDIKVGFLGAGKMGGILLEGLIKAGMTAPGNIVFCEPAAGRAKEVAEKTGAVLKGSAAEVVEASDLFFLCVKPDQFPGVAGDFTNAWSRKKPCCASIMAGVKTSRIRELVSPDIQVIRIMPNVACTVGKGVAGVAKDDTASAAHNEFVFGLFEALGGAVWVKESAMDAVTAISGSGPAYVFMFIEALTDAGVRVGLDRVTAKNLAVKTVAGAAEMALLSGMDTLQLRAQVSSPGGTTVAATSVLEEKGFRSAVIEAVCAAWNRSLELGR